MLPIMAVDSRSYCPLFLMLLFLQSGCTSTPVETRMMDSATAAGGKFDARVMKQTESGSETSFVEVENKELKTIQRVYSSSAAVKLMIRWRSEKDLDVCFAYKDGVPEVGLGTLEPASNAPFTVQFYAIGACPYSEFEY